jgi:zinc transport system permease protein
VKTIDYLTDPSLAPYYWPGVLTTLVVAVLGGSLSWLVVVKRLSFIGQGVSHSAFGGVGVALVLGISGATVYGGLATTGVVLAFSLLAALGIAMLSGAESARADTAIGIVLSVTMAIGFLLYHVAEGLAAGAGNPPPPALEQILFGSITLINPIDLWLAVGTSALVIAALWTWRHRILFWMFDEAAAPAFGVPVAAVRVLVMALLSLMVVVTMKLAGVVLVTAVLVLPGALALQLTDRLRPAVALSIAAALVSAVVGIIVSFELDLQPGPTIVLALGVLYFLTWVPRRLAAGAAPASPENPA